MEDDDRGNGDLAGLGNLTGKREKATEATNGVLREELHHAKLQIASMREEIARLQGVIEDLQRQVAE